MGDHDEDQDSRDAKPEPTRGVGDEDAARREQTARKPQDDDADNADTPAAGDGHGPVGLNRKGRDTPRLHSWGGPEWGGTPPA